MIRKHLLMWQFLGLFVLGLSACTSVIAAPPATEEAPRPDTSAPVATDANVVKTDAPVQAAEKQAVAVYSARSEAELALVGNTGRPQFVFAFANW